MPKISPGAYIFQRLFLGAYIQRGSSTEGNLHFKIEWASLIIGSKFTVFSLFYFVVEGLCLEGRSNRGFFCVTSWGFTFGGNYTWRCLFAEFYGMQFEQLGISFGCTLHFPSVSYEKRLPGVMLIAAWGNPSNYSTSM